MEKAGISECTPEATCLYCSKLDVEVWDKIFATRAKREARRKLALQKSSEAPTQLAPPSDRIEQMADVPRIRPLEAFEASISQAVSKAMTGSRPLPAETIVKPVVDTSALYTADEGDSSSSSSSRCSSPVGGIPPSGRVSMIDFLADHEDPASQSSFQPEHQLSKPASVMLDQPEADMLQFLRTLVPGSPEWKDVCAKISMKALLHWIAANSSFDVTS